MKSLNDESHAGRELPLMLEGRKPLAVFHDLVLADSVDDEIERDFAPYVEQGRFVRCEAQDLWPEPLVREGKSILGTRLRLYALPGEKWRMDAYLLLSRATQGQPWNDSLETFVCLLLGYTDAEIAARIEHVHKTRGGWGAVPAYLKVSNEDLEKVRQLGFRALPPDRADEIVLILSDSVPNDELLASAYHPEPSTLLRFGLDAKFVLKLPSEEAQDVRIVRLPPGSVVDLNRNLKSTIEIIQQATGVVAKK